MLASLAFFAGAMRSLDSKFELASFDLQCADRVAERWQSLADERGLPKLESDCANSAFRQFRERLLQEGHRAAFFPDPKSPQVLQLTRAAEELGLLAITPSPDYTANRNGESGDRVHGLRSWILSQVTAWLSQGLIDQPARFLELGPGSGAMMTALRESEVPLSTWGVADRYMIDGRGLFNVFLRKDSRLVHTPFIEWLYTTLASNQSRSNAANWSAILSKPSHFARFLQTTLIDPELAFCGAAPSSLRFLGISGAWTEGEVNGVWQHRGLKTLIDAYLSRPKAFIDENFMFPGEKELPWVDLYASSWGRVDLSRFDESSLLSMDGELDVIYSSFGVTHMPESRPNILCASSYSRRFWDRLILTLNPFHGVLIHNSYRNSQHGNTRWDAETYLQKRSSGTSWALISGQSVPTPKAQMLIHTQNLEALPISNPDNVRPLSDYLDSLMTLTLELFQRLLIEAIEELELDTGETLMQREWGKIEENYARLFRELLRESPEFSADWEAAEKELEQGLFIADLDLYFHLAAWQSEETLKRRLSDQAPAFFRLVQGLSQAFEKDKLRLLAQTPAARLLLRRAPAIIAAA